MTSVDPTPTTTLLANVRRLGLTHTAESLDDLIARATRSRWSPTVLLDTLVQAELEARARRRLERQLQAARLGRFKPLADFEWTWPKQLDRPTVDRVFSLDFIAKGENVVLVAAQGLGKTMLTKNLLHQAVLAGHSALFITASDLLLDLNGQDTSRALERRLRAYARPQILAIDEIGYLSYDAHAADLLFQVISRRYEQRSIVVTTNLLFKQWDTVFPNASCAVALVDRLTHHAEIIPIEGESYRKREAELTQKKRRAAPGRTSSNRAASGTPRSTAHRWSSVPRPLVDRSPSVYRAYQDDRRRDKVRAITRHYTLPVAVVAGRMHGQGGVIHIRNMAVAVRVRGVEEGQLLHANGSLVPDCARAPYARTARTNVDDRGRRRALRPSCHCARTPRDHAPYAESSRARRAAPH